MPRPIAVIDAETDPFRYGRVPKPFIWGFYDGEEFLHFETVEELIEFLEPQNIVVYAHNGGKFDYHFFLEHLSPYDHINVINGRMAKFKIGCCEFRDSWNILPVPLAQYQKDEIDYDIFEEGEREKPENRRAIIDYLESDCVYLFDMVSAFIDEFGRGLTIAGSAMKYWKKLSGQPIPESSQYYYELFSKYYYGGRVECFKKGIIDEDFKTADINSAYPFAMLRNHPYGLDYSYISIKSELDSHTIVGHGFYTLECISRGAFPFRDSDGSLIFPNDGEARVYHVTGWELLTAIELEAVGNIQLITAIVHEHLITFDEYIYHFYNRRLEAKRKEDKKEDIFCKLFMNSLYGKFGANPEKYGKFIVVPPDAVGSVLDDAKRGQDTDLYNYKFAGTIGPWGLGRADLEEFEMKFYNAATAASITGFVRAYLFRHLYNAVDPIYCDTDSIAAKDFGDMKMGKKLGEWELEGEFDFGAVAGKKLYAFRYAADFGANKTGDFKIAAKGVRLNADHIIGIAEGADVSYIPMAPSFSINKPPTFTPRRVTMR